MVTLEIRSSPSSGAVPLLEGCSLLFLSDSSKPFLQTCVPRAVTAASVPLSQGSVCDLTEVPLTAEVQPQHPSSGTSLAAVSDEVPEPPTC